MSIEKHSLFNLDTVIVQDGYDLKSVPELTKDNLLSIIEKQNQIIIALNALMSRFDIWPADKEEFQI